MTLHRHAVREFGLVPTSSSVAVTTKTCLELRKFKHSSQFKDRKDQVYLLSAVGYAGTFTQLKQLRAPAQ